MHGWRRQRSRSKAAATAQAVLASRTSERRHGPCRVLAPYRTAPEDGKGPGERHETHYTAKFWRRLSPKGAGQHLCLRLLAGSHGFCGKLWDISPCLHSMFLCRRWWVSCRTLSSSFVRSHLILSRLSKYPRSCHSMSLCARRARSAAGGTAGGSADDHFLFLVTADCGADRGHSSSWWWRTNFWSSRFFLWTEFNSDAFLQETHFWADCGADR